MDVMTPQCWTRSPAVCWCVCSWHGVQLEFDAPVSSVLEQSHTLKNGDGIHIHNFHPLKHITRWFLVCSDAIITTLFRIIFIAVLAAVPPVAPPSRSGNLCSRSLARSLSVRLPGLDILWECDHMIRGLLCPVPSVSLTTSRCIRGAAYGSILFLSG